MYFQAFSPDEKYVVFSANRTGDFELYRFDIKNTSAAQITSGFKKTYNYTCFKNKIILNDSEKVKSIDIESLEENTVFEKKQDWIELFGGPAISEIGNWVACFYKDKDGKLGIVYKNLTNSDPAETLKLPEGIKTVSHLLAAPSEELILTFNILPDKQNDSGLPDSQRARSWKLDVKKEKLEPFLVMPAGFRATHEYWGHNRNLRLYFHKKTVPSWVPNVVASIDINGRDYKEHLFSQTRRLGHSAISYDNRFMVSDVQQPGENELYLLDTRTEKYEIICWPDSSCNPERNQLGHVHPSFSSRGNYIIYSSDRNGKTSVYIVPLII